MSIGIGLGGFMQGFQGGLRARDAMDDRKRQAKLDERSDADYARRQVLQQREDTEYNRAMSQRNEIDTINQNAKAEFNNRVNAGTAKPDQYSDFFSRYTLPKLEQTYLSQGDLESAKRVRAWGDSADAKTGARLAMSAITKANTGDAAGALADAMEAGKLKGYISHGMEIKGQDQILDPQGKLIGYRLNMVGQDGKPLVQDLPLDQVPKLIATYLNPEAAWESQVAAQSDAAKTKKDLAVYEEKKRIDKRYGTGDEKDRSAAITSIRKRMADTLDPDAPKFDDLPREEQEALIAKELDLQRGQPGLAGAMPSAGATPAGPSRKVLVDTATGKPVVGLGN